MINQAIDCKSCSKRQDMRCAGYIEFAATQKRDLPPEPFSGCITPIVERYKSFIKAGDRVLEIGCGAWSPIKDYCVSIGADYQAIDTEEFYGDSKSIATRIENLNDLSFDDEEFDFVFGNQTMEHWEEYGCANSWGLFQCFRVCNKGGIVAMNVSIHFHGTRFFVNGDIDSIRKLFSDFSNEIDITSWGRVSHPLRPYYAHPYYSLLREKAAYALDIIAIKHKASKQMYLKNMAETALSAASNHINFLIFYICACRNCSRFFWKNSDI